MSTFTDTVIILPRPTPASAVWAELSACFERHSVTFEPDTNVVFNDFDGEGKQPTIVDSEANARDGILSWPGLGGTEYSMPRCRMTVFLGGQAARQVDFVTLSVSDRAYSSDAEIRRTFDHIGQELHERLGAKRTIRGFELLSPDGWVDAEVDRVRRDTSAGS